MTAVDRGAPLYGYRATGHDVLAAAAVLVLGAALATAVARTLRRDTTGWWAVLLVLPPAALLLLQPTVTAASDVTGLDAHTGWPFPAAAAALTVLASAALPVAVLFRNRWQRG